MAKMVMVSKNPDLKIGKIYRGLARGPWYEPEPNQRFLVVAKSDEQGWIDCCVSYSGEGERSWLQMLACINGPWYYYEILTD